MNAHLSFRYRRRRTALQQREFCAVQRERICKRWEKRQTDAADDPMRCDQAARITIEHSKRPRTIVVVTRREEDGRMGRWQGIGPRGLTGAGIGKLIGEFLR
jgi:hypothetical protein